MYNILDSKYLKEVEKIGFNKDYIIKCLLENEINYATSSYYILESTISL